MKKHAWKTLTKNWSGCMYQWRLYETLIHPFNRMVDELDVILRLFKWVYRLPCTGTVYSEWPKLTFIFESFKVYLFTTMIYMYCTCAVNNQTQYTEFLKRDNLGAVYCSTYSSLGLCGSGKIQLVYKFWKNLNWLDLEGQLMQACNYWHICNRKGV